jgi:hypothetical protein
MKIELPIIYSQWDVRWADKMLGYNKNLPYNFHNFACLITCQAMCLRYYGIDATPITVNDSLLNLGQNIGFASGTGNYVWGALSKVWKQISEKRTVTPNLLTDAQIGEIKGAIDKGFPVMVEIDVNPKTVQADMHFVLFIGYDPNDENNFTIADPLGGRIRSLKDYLGFLVPNARRTISQYIIYSGTVPQNATNTMPVDKQLFRDLVHGSSEWDKTVKEYKGDANPKATFFEDVQKVVNGIKSRSTDLENQNKEKDAKLAAAAQEIENRKEQVSRLEQQLIDKDKTHKAELDALKASMPDASKLIGEYQGRIKVLEGQVDEVSKAKGQALNELAVKTTECERLQRELNKAKATKVVSCFETLVTWLRTLLPKNV